MKANLRPLLLWGLIITSIVLLLGRVPLKPEGTPNFISFSEFMRFVREGQVESVTFVGENEIEGKFKPTQKGGAVFKSYGNTNANVVLEEMRKAGITENYKPEPKPSPMMALLVNWLPVMAILFIFFLFMRQLQSGSSKALSFGQSKARLFNEHQSKIKFVDVAGCDEAKEELEEIVDFLKNPKKFTRLGGRIPKGVLLVGAPGTGKTLLAKAIAGEAAVPFFSISGSDFVEMFVGVGASRVRSLFENAKKAAPCLIFIDEIDAVGRHRGAGLGGGHDEREQTLNQLLVEMDGFEGNEGIIMIAATNRADVLDPALLRPGRFDRRVIVHKPDIKGRLAILQVHTKKTPLASDVQLEHIARGTPGFAGADLENLVNEAALVAARNNHDTLSMHDFDHAKDKVSMGSARRSMVMSDEERRNTAFHEAGHALVARLTPGTDPVHKVTIIPRGMALGVTMSLPTEDRYTLTKEKAEGQIVVLMGGRVAEEIVFGQTTTGASNDIERATELARSMVTRWGMSEKFGPVNFGSKNDNIFLGRDMSTGSTHSEETGRMIDAEIREIVERNNEKAKKLVLEKRAILDAMAEALLKYETIDMEDIAKLMDGKTLDKPLPEAAAKIAAATQVQQPAAEGSFTSPTIDLTKGVKV